MFLLTLWSLKMSSAFIISGCSPRSLEESDMTERLHFHFSLSCIGEGNGHPLQCSCLENPRDGGSWWAAVYGVAQSWTQLKRLSSSSLKNVMALPLVKGLVVVVQSSELPYDNLTNISLQPQTWTFWEIPSENPSEKPFPNPDPWLACYLFFSHVWLFAILRAVACQAALSMRFPRQEYWSGLPFPTLGNLPNSGIEFSSPALHCRQILQHLGHQGSPIFILVSHNH